MISLPSQSNPKAIPTPFMTWIAHGCVVPNAHGPNRIAKKISHSEIHSLVR